MNIHWARHYTILTTWPVVLTQPMCKQPVIPKAHLTRAQTLSLYALSVPTTQVISFEIAL